MIMYFLIKRNKHIFYHYCWKVNRNICIKYYRNSNYYNDCNNIVKSESPLNIIDFIKYLLLPENAVILNNKVYDYKHLQFDYYNKEIKVGDILFIKGNKCVVTKFGLKLRNIIIEYSIIDFSLGNFNNYNIDNTLNNYLNTCVNLSDYCNVKYRFNKVVNERQIINNFDVKHLMSKSLVQQIFYSYLYIISIFNLWDKAGFIFSCNCMKFKHHDICFVLDLKEEINIE